MQKIKVSERIHIVGANGVTNIDVDMTFDIPPSTYSVGMTLIATQEIQHAVQRIIEKAKKLK